VLSAILTCMVNKWKNYDNWQNY